MCNFNINDFSLFQPLHGANDPHNEVRLAKVNENILIIEVKAELQALRRSIQRSSCLRSGSGTSIWTELGQWRAAVVWMLMGAAVMGMLQDLIFQGSGFQSALSDVRASGGTVDRRLERIEIWLGIVEDD